MVDFLLARSEEDLQHAGCSYEATSTGDLRCLCERPSSETLETVAKASLIRRWSSDPQKDPMLRLLADEYVWHPDYREGWHPIG